MHDLQTFLSNICSEKTKNIDWPIDFGEYSTHIHCVLYMHIYNYKYFIVQKKPLISCFGKRRGHFLPLKHVLAYLDGQNYIVD